MTEQRSLKQLVRARMLETGESYAKARRRILAQYQEPENLPAGGKSQEVFDHALGQIQVSQRSREAQAAAVLRWRERGLIREVPEEAITRVTGREQPGLSALLVRGPEWGRLLLGRVKEQLTAAERGVSMLVIGPAGSGKTDSVIIPNLLVWEGPAVVLGRKSGVEATVKQRGKRGPVYVYDPAGVMEGGGEATGLYQVCGFSPLMHCEEADNLYPGQSRIAWNACWKSAADFCAGLERGTASDWGYWAESAMRLLGPLFFAAKLGGKTMAEVTQWVIQEDVKIAIELIEEAARGAGLGKNPSGHWEVTSEFSGGLKAGEVEIALESLHSIDKRPDKVRGTVFTICQGLFYIYEDEVVRASLDKEPLDAERLIQKRGTLYLVIPEEGGERLAGLFTALLDFLVEKAQAGLGQTPRGRLNPRLGLFLDEMVKYCPSHKLDKLADQGGTEGITVLLTVQDIAELRQRYGDRERDLIVQGCKAKLIMAGITDPEEAEYLCEILNQESGANRNYYQLSPELVLSLKPGEALLWYPKLRSPDYPRMFNHPPLGPVRLQLQPWFQQLAGENKQETEKAGSGEASREREDDPEKQ